MTFVHNFKRFSWEDLERKRAVLREAEAFLSPNAVLATDTSSLRVADPARGLARPQRMVGLHFFNPVDRMGLVEVVRGPETTDEAVGRALGLVLRLGKVPVLVKDGTGFLVNRLLGVYISHALGILWWGARPETVDEALERFGWPMGPLRLIDVLGVETVHRVTEILHLAYPERIRRPVLLEGLLKQGRTGRKAGFS